MARDIVSSANVDLESSGRRDYWVALGHTSVWGSHLIPLTVIVGPQARPGQGLVAPAVPRQRVRRSRGP